MDEATLRSHQGLWVEEKDQHAAETLPLLTDPEQAVYQAIKRNARGQHVRLEQERIAWMSPGRHCGRRFDCWVAINSPE